MLLGLLVLVLQAGILLRQLLVHTVEGVNLQHVAAQHLTQCGQLLLQSHDLGSIAALHPPELFEEFLGALLLLIQLCHQ